MNPFSYVRAVDAGDASHRVAAVPSAKLLGGGTNLIDLMKMGVERPSQLIDINRLPLGTIEALPGNAGLRIGALARNSDVAEHPLVSSQYPVLRDALLAGASQQLRNLATVGGNLLQRTRCPYFYDPVFAQCNKRSPGSGCAALKGYNRMHAILGQSEQCIATHPSDMCVGLATLEASVRVLGGKGERTIPFGEFHRLPGDTPHLETNLAPDEVITAVDLGPLPAGTRAHYLKVRDRASYAFAVVSVAVVMQLDASQKLGMVRIALGGVAHKPWRAEKAEAELQGIKPSPEAFQRAAQIALTGAAGYQYNTFKIELAKRCIVRALTNATSNRGEA